MLEQRICKRCGKVFEIDSKSERMCCSTKCSMSRERNAEVRKKISETLKARTDNKKKRICKVCGKEYYFQRGLNTKVMCSKECSLYYKMHTKDFLSKEARQKLSETGRKNASKQFELKRSLNEIYFCELCENYFNKVGNNLPIFNGWDADVLIFDKEIAVLWNGKWHYEQISKKISLECIQNRDKIKLNEIKNCGWTPYVIKDMGRHDKDFVEQEFEKFKGFVKLQ